MDLNLSDLEALTRKSVSHFWNTRGRQQTQQAASGTADQGARGCVTGGKQMDGFVEALCTLVCRAGMPDACIYRNKHIELPGFFRPTKQWDLLIVDDAHLLAVIELKSQVGPSFGNNFNNRTEEAIGSAVDLWTAYREGAFKSSPRPWLGYLFLLEDCPKSRSPVATAEPHFPVLPEFKGASYLKRYELFCRKLIHERHYEAAAYLTSVADTGKRGVYAEPAADLALKVFATSLMAKMAAHAALKGGS